MPGGCATGLALTSSKAFQAPFSTGRLGPRFVYNNGTPAKRPVIVEATTGRHGPDKSAQGAAMLHHTSLIATIVAGIGLAFVFGVLANRLHLSPLVGYLLAGVLLGPFTPGFVADQALAPQLAEIGVILLMFGVGLHFSFKDLLAVRAIAVPGALGQITLVTLLGLGLAHLLGWSWGAGVIFGLALSVASTVVVLRTLQERRLIETERGRIAVGWLIVEDLAMVLALFLTPALAGLMGGQLPDQADQAQENILVAWLQPRTIWGALGITSAKVGAFVALMLIVGRRLIP